VVVYGNQGKKARGGRDRNFMRRNDQAAVGGLAAH